MALFGGTKRIFELEKQVRRLQTRLCQGKHQYVEAQRGYVGGPGMGDEELEVVLQCSLCEHVKKETR